MTDTALYAYGVLPRGAATPAPGSAESILPGASPFLVSEGELAVLVSAVPRLAFEAGEHCRMADPAWVAARAAAHHAVIAAAAAEGAVLPLAFGALFSGEAPLRAWLRGSAGQLAAALGTVAGCEEWTLTVTEDVAGHVAWLNATHDTLRKLATDIAAAPEGTAFLLERRRDKALAGLRAEHRQRIALEAAEAFAVSAQGVEPAPPQADRVAAWSALLPIAVRPAMQARLGALAAAAAETGLGLSLSGPWPPYAFARGALRHAG